MTKLPKAMIVTKSIIATLVAAILIVGCDDTTGVPAETQVGQAPTTPDDPTPEVQARLLYRGNREPFRDVSWNGARYVAVSSSHIFYSDNGESWIEVESVKGDPRQLRGGGWRHVISDGTRFVVVGTDVAYSFDGKTWAYSSTRNNSYYDDIVWHNSRFLAVDSGPQTDVRTSVSGDTWQDVDVTSSVETEGLWAMVASNNKLVAVTAGGQIVHSPAGSQWTVATSSGQFKSHPAPWDPAGENDASFKNITLHGTRYVAIGTTAIYSDVGGDGDLWMEADRTIPCAVSPGANCIKDTWPIFTVAVASNGEFVLAAGGNRFMLSRDGRKWIGATADLHDVYNMIWDGTRFIGVGGSISQGRIVEIIIKQ